MPGNTLHLENAQPGRPPREDIARTGSRWAQASFHGWGGVFPGLAGELAEAGIGDRDAGAAGGEAVGETDGAGRGAVTGFMPPMSLDVCFLVCSIVDMLIHLWFSWSRQA